MILNQIVLITKKLTNEKLKLIMLKLEKYYKVEKMKVHGIYLYHYLDE